MGLTHATAAVGTDSGDDQISKDAWDEEHVLDAQIVAVFDGGGSAISGNPEVDVVIPANGAITSYTMLADPSGSAVIDVWKSTYADYPPTNDDSITASAPPTLSSAAKATDSTLTGWTTSLTTGDILRFHLDSSSTVKRLVLTLAYTRS
jgi:hypothetical protein